MVLLPGSKKSFKLKGYMRNQTGSSGGSVDAKIPKTNELTFRLNQINVKKILRKHIATNCQAIDNNHFINNKNVCFFV